jgi:hypothetical protein
VLISNRLALVWQEIYLNQGLATSSRCNMPVYMNIQPFISRTSDELDFEGCLGALCNSVEVSSNDQEKDDHIFADQTDITGRMVPRLRDKQYCRSIQDRVEYYAMRIHLTFASTARMIRVLQRITNGVDDGQRRLILACKYSCLETIDAFLCMQALTLVPLRTWIFLHSSLASALLLHWLDPEQSSKVKEAQKSFHEVLSRMEEGHTPDSEPAMTFTRRYHSAMEGLEKMISHEGKASVDGRHASEPQESDRQALTITDFIGSANQHHRMESPNTMSASRSPGTYVPDLNFIWLEYFDGRSHIGFLRLFAKH